MLFRRLKVRNSFRGGKKYGAVRLEQSIHSHFEGLIQTIWFVKDIQHGRDECFFSFIYKDCQENTDFFGPILWHLATRGGSREARPKVRLDNFRDRERMGENSLTSRCAGLPAGGQLFFYKFVFSSGNPEYWFPSSFMHYSKKNIV